MVLGIVRTKQAGSSQEKREFLRSPQQVWREELKLDASGYDAAADRLFIETQQFSERVSGIEVWQKPVLPWIKPNPNSWLPESFGLRIGDPPDARHIPLAPGEADILAVSLETAIKAGRSEEHTSELQSLMRLSYAVFCVKHKIYTSLP